MHMLLTGYQRLWKSDLSDKVKWKFFQAGAVSVLLSGCTTLALTKCMEKKPDEKDAACCFGQILEAAPHKTVTV